jgi:hypothetical protein
MDKGIYGDRSGAESPASSKMPDDGVRRALSISGKRPRRAHESDYEVLVDLPDPLPVTKAELDLLENELSAFIAELLKT